MREYQQHIFYDTSDLTPDQQEAICREAKENCYHWHVDHRPGWAREEIDMPFDEILKYIHAEAPVHFTVIFRGGFEPKPPAFPEYHLEIGFCTLARKTKLPTTDIDIKGDLFLWIKLDKKYISRFIQKYDLKKR